MEGKAVFRSKDLSESTNSLLSNGPTTGATKRKSGANQSAPPLLPSAVPASCAAVNAFARAISSSGGITNAFSVSSAASSAMPAVGSLPSSAAMSGLSVGELVVVATIRGAAQRGASV